MTFADHFLEDLDSRTWRAPEGAPRAITTSTVFLGAGDHALEVAVASAAARPKADDMRKLWHARQGKRPSPVLLVVGYPEHGDTRVSVCGPVGEQPPVIHGLEASQVERVAAAALTEPSRHSAIRFLVAMLPEVGADLPGLRNSGLLATQELRNGVPARHDWQRACTRSRNALPLRGRQLVEKLGFGIEQLSVTSSILTVGGGGKRAVAVFLDQGETFDEPADRFASTPVSHALALADREGVPWVVLTRARQIRLYAARSDTGVGRKGRAETFVEVDLALLPEDRAGYVDLLFSASALKENGTLDDILRQSADFAAELAIRLRERVYFEAVPGLATAVAGRVDRNGALTEDDLSAAYEQTLIILFRLLFLAYAEDKDLLPYRTNSRYADHALKTIARRLSEDRVNDKVSFDAGAIDLWEDVRQLWRTVDKGNSGWGVPGYNGGLFSDKADVNPAGAALARIDLTDAEFGPALMALLVDHGPDGVVGPVDFRSLSVREFGTIYEGLLESMLSISPSDLTVDAKGNYVPTKKAGDVVVAAGDIYFHNRSGARKATGSYFTKPFAVEHLLDHALEPALAEHVARLQALLDQGDEVAAAEAFFDFRCVDLAMGSGHFLVAAVDRIEARLSGFLALHPIAPVVAEMERLRQAAVDALGDLADGVEIETTSLLRRQVARRCIYGVDLNRISVELARLAIWIHTFVPGLPLSFLDHSLVRGNSLTGIGTIDEAINILDPKAAKAGAVSLFRSQIDEFLGRASDALRRLARVTEATVADVEAARKAHLEALEAVRPARDLFDLLIAGRLGETDLVVTADEDAIEKNKGLPKARDLAKKLEAMHFPVAFPEVFERDRPGFDCILGNPPWEKLHVEEHGFWALRFPGLRGLAVTDLNREMKRLRSARPDLVAELGGEIAAADLMRATLLRGPYPELGSGHPDLYKAFSWRFWALIRQGGAIGVVLPRSALSATGSSEWRRTILNEGTFSSVTTTINTAGWVFDDAEPRYTIAFVALRKGRQDASIELRGPYASRGSYERSRRDEPLQIWGTDLLNWSAGAAFPLIPGRRAGEAFLRMRATPRFDSAEGGWRPKPVQGDLNATQGKSQMVFGQSARDDLWPVYSGGSFNLWSPDNGPDSYYAWIDPEIAIRVLQERRVSSARRAGSVFTGFDTEWVADPDTLPCWYPRIAFRDVARATDRRTIIPALIPGSVVVTHKAPYLLLPGGDERDEAYLIGVVSSIPFDWYARRVVETSVSFDLLGCFPLPRPDREDRLRKLVETAAGRLAAVDSRYEYWAEAVGVPTASVGDNRADLTAELDAAVAHLYGLAEDDVKVIFETFHVGWDYSTRLSSVLDHFREMA
ncbi:MAG: hypothetical protein HYX34_03900 [Actinobacteria bacterium]|nr:hypothetical protein [Actinomycetota bacterium]